MDLTEIIKTLRLPAYGLYHVSTLDEVRAGDCLYDILLNSYKNLMNQRDMT